MDCTVSSGFVLYLECLIYTVLSWYIPSRDEVHVEVISFKGRVSRVEKACPISQMAFKVGMWEFGCRVRRIPFPWL